MVNAYRIQSSPVVWIIEFAVRVPLYNFKEGCNKYYTKRFLNISPDCLSKKIKDPLTVFVLTANTGLKISLDSKNNWKEGLSKDDTYN